MKKIKLIEKIEGEARLKFSYYKDFIDFVEIEFFSIRNIENILKNRPALDALVISPRVCGICGHAHLQASVGALENAFCIKISKKAKIIRDLTLNFEIIQNHFKWFYLTIFPLLSLKQNPLKAIFASKILAKAIALFGGQYPHNSYSIVGGVVCDPTFFEIVKAKKYIDEVLYFFEKEVLKSDLEELMGCSNVEILFKKDGDLPKILNILKKENLLEIGKSYDRFIVFGQNSFFKRGKSLKTRVTQNIDEKFIKEFENENSFAKNVVYKDKYYEVGPLSRAMLNKTPLIKDAHRRYKDSLFSRIVARVCEIPRLLFYSKELLDQINLDEPSFIEPKDLDKNATGFFSVEAARGSLFHKVSLKDGKIKDYTIITPTQWNLANGTKTMPGVAQKAMIGLKDEKLAELVFKSFDVCSVCTTH